MNMSGSVPDRIKKSHIEISIEHDRELVFLDTQGLWQFSACLDRFYDLTSILAHRE